MLIVVIFAVFIIGGAVKTAIDDGAYMGYISSTLIGAFFGGIVAAIINVGILFGAHYAFDKEYVETESEELYALNDRNTIQGRFYLGSGRIEEVPKYYIMAKSERGLKMETISTSDAYVNEDNSQKPNIVTYSSKFKSKIVQFAVGSPWVSDEYEITIPKDSVINNYNIDLE